MATGLNVGHWAWTRRWAYPDEHEQLAEQLTARLEPGVSLPKIPMRYGEEHERLESTYTGSFTQRAPPRVASAIGGDQQTYRRERQRIRGKKTAPREFLHHHTSPFYHETKEQRANLKPEDHSFRISGRLNPAHAVNPYITESQRQFVRYDDADPVDRRYYIKVMRKDYKEAIAKQINIDKSKMAPAKH